MRLVLSLFLLPSVLSFTTTTTFTAAKSSLFSTTESTDMSSQTASFPDYTEEQLKGALDSLLEGSEDPSFDGRHLFGFGDPSHKLSKLQSITATRILDYEAYLVSIKR